MKLSALSKCVKNGGVCSVYRVGPFGEVWVRTLHGVYRLNGFPKPMSMDEMGMLLGIGTKTMEGIAYNEFTEEDALNIAGYDLDDVCEREIRMVSLDLAATIHNQEFKLLSDENKRGFAIVETDELAPLQDEFQRSGYMAYYLRERPNGEKYIVVKDGFSTRAAIMQPETKIREAVQDAFLEALTLMRAEDAGFNVIPNNDDEENDNGQA